MTLVDRLLARRAHDRPTSAADVRDELRRLALDEPAAVRSDPVSPSGRPAFLSWISVV